MQASEAKMAAVSWAPRVESVYTRTLLILRPGLHVGRAQHESGVGHRVQSRVSRVPTEDGEPEQRGHVELARDSGR